MTDLPPAIKAAQEKLRPRVDAQSQRMEAFAAEAFAARLSSDGITHDVSAEEALDVLVLADEKAQ